MTLPRYPAYKDSGVEWLGEVPEHWVESRIKASLASIRNGDWGNEPQNSPIICVRVADFDRQKFAVDLGNEPTLREYDFDKILGRTLSVGDLLIEKSGGGENQLVGAVVYCGLECEGAMHSNFTARMQPEPTFVSRFLVYVFAATYHARLNLRSIKQSTGIQNLDSNQYLAERWYWPHPEEQAAIATFLDYETSKIDALIAEQKNLIALLKEKRQAVISHAVTKGLNPDVPMKDSGVEWLGEVPEHWKIGSLKHALEVVADVDHYMPSSVDSGVPYVMTGDLRKLASEIDLGSCKQITREDFLKLTRKIRTSKGDVIMARYATIGSVSYVDIDAEFVVSYSCVTIRPRVESAIGIYLFFYFQSDAFIQGISKMINANTQENVGIGDLKEVKVALPDTNEQKAIVRDLESKLVQLDRIAKDLEAAIRLLVERRSALISAAVTGKIDVRGLVAQEAA